MEEIHILQKCKGKEIVTKKKEREEGGMEGEREDGRWMINPRG